jgi:hypothetical protein
MAEIRRAPGIGTGWLAMAAVAVAAILASVGSYATEGSPFARITAWQMDKLRDTEFSTHPVKKKGDSYFLSRRIRSGEIFERLMQSYCDRAGLDAEKCKEVVAKAQEHHLEEHWHKNWQDNDEIFFLVPKEIYEPASTGK